MANQYSIASISPATDGTYSGPVRGRLNAILKNSTELKYCVPNEYICAEIGRFIGLPIPPCGLCYMRPTNKDDASYWFASWNFNLANSDLPPIDRQECCKHFPFESAGLVLFDILIGNCDRHENNLSLDVSASPCQLSVFDHGAALFGLTNGEGQKRLSENMDDFIIGFHCLIDSLTTDLHFGEWIDRINGLPNYLIDQSCDATVPLGMITPGEAHVAKTFLKHRKSELKNIIKANQREFAGIQAWKLL